MAKAPKPVMGFSKAYEQAKHGGAVRFWGLTALAIGLIPVVGFGISHFFERHKNNIVANRQMKLLADYYRAPVAARLGIDPRSVGPRELQMAANIDPNIRQAISKVRHDQDNANRGSLLSTGGAYAVGAVFTPAGVVAKIAADTTGMFAGDAVSHLFDKDVLHVQDMVSHLEAKRAAGQTITAQDVAMLRIAQNEGWQKEFKQKHGHAFHKLDANQQSQFIQSMPGVFGNVQADAESVNSGGRTIQNLVAPTVVNDNLASANDNGTNWAERVGGSKGRNSSFVAAVNAERAANANSQGLA